MELPVKTNAFQIKPDLENIIPTVEVKKIISKILNDTLLNKTYSTDNAKIWTKSIADEINRSLKHQRYKHAVQVVITQKLGQGFKYTARARWDVDTDRQITESFANDTIICVATVFGVYLY